VGLIALFSYLQALDLLTTMVFLAAGVREANPIVNFALRSADSPLQALLVVKALAFLIAFYCWRAGRHSLLVRVNWFFAAIVAWNILALLMSVAQFS
jgi:hypothetical protein